MPFTPKLDALLPRDFRRDQLSAICANPTTCCLFWWCGSCMVYQQRVRLLDITKEPYVMCAGTFPCCGFEKPMPEFCLVVEVCLCFDCAIAGNKVMTQTRFGLRNDFIDECCSCFNFCITCEFMLLRLCCECSEEREELRKAACCIHRCSVCQVAGELSRARKTAYSAPPANIIAALPEHFSNVGIVLASAPLQATPLS